MRDYEQENVAYRERLKRQNAAKAAWWANILATVKPGDYIAVGGGGRVRLVEVSKVTKKLIWSGTGSYGRVQYDERDVLAGPITDAQAKVLDQLTMTYKAKLSQADDAYDAIADPATKEYAEATKNLIGADPTVSSWERWNEIL